MCGGVCSPRTAMTPRCHRSKTSSGLRGGDERRCTYEKRRRAEASRRGVAQRDRKSTRLNSSHSQISYAVFCLKKKNNLGRHDRTRQRTDLWLPGQFPKCQPNHWIAVI